MNAFITLEARPQLTPAFSPRLQQAVRLLQLSSLEYSQALHDAALLNPFLEVEDAAQPAEARAADEASGEPSGEKFDPCADSEAAAAFDRLTAAPAAGKHLSHEDSSDFMQRVALADSLRDHLHAQLGVLRLSEREKALARAVVESLDDDGYLRISLAEIAAAFEETGTEVEHELRTALCRVQALEPTGIGARDVQECLRLQLGAVVDPCTRALAACIVEEHIDSLASHDLGRIAAAAGVSLAAVQRAAEAIRRFDPRPGWRYGETGACNIVADVTVRKVRGVWRTTLNAGAVPRVRINTACAQLMEKQRTSQCANLRSYLEQARWLVGSVSQRASTILDVARAIVGRQKLFLEHGPLAMKPLGLREIADEVGVHPSTVSRSVHNKYLATPAGIFELQHFFSRGMRHESGGASAPLALRELIRELIASEPGAEPFSDAALARALGQQGFRIARRTVTKYRQTLQIDPVEVRRAKAGYAAAV